MQTKSLTAVLKARDSGFTSTFGKATSLLNKFSGNQGRAAKTGNSFAGGLKTMVGALGLYKVASAGASLVTNNLSGAVQRFDTINNFPKVMKNMGVSAEDSEKAINKLSDGIDGLPTALDDVVSTTQRFLPMTGTIDKAAESTLSLNNAFLASGASGVDASRGLTQYVQMLGKGKVDMQSWNSLQETMPYALKKTAEAFGITSGSSIELYDKLKDGEITMDQLNDKFIELNGGVGGFAEVAKTATGGIGTAFTNLGNRTKKGLEEIIKSVDKVSTKFTGSDIATHVSNTGTKIKEVLTVVGSKIEWAADKVSWAAGQIKPYLDVIKNGFDQVKGPVLSAGDAIVQSLKTLYSQFDKTASINSFQSIIQLAADKINQFAGYIEKNSDSIAKFISMLPKMVAGFLAFNQIKSVIQVVAGFGAGITETLDKVFAVTTGLDKKFKNNVLNPLSSSISSGFSVLSPYLEKFKSNFKFSMETLTQYDDKGKFRNFVRSIGESLSSLSPNFDSFRANLRSSQRQLSQLGEGNKVTNFIRSFGASIDLSSSKLGRFGSALLHPIQSVNNLGYNLMSASQTANGSGTVIHGAALKIGAGFKSMAAAGISGIKSLGAAMLSNPVTATLVAMTAVVVGVVAAWRSNFQNIQGVIKSFGSGVVESITSLKEQFTFAKPVVDALANVFKGSFKVAVSGAMVAVGLLVDAFRSIVTAGLTVVKTALAVGNGIKGLWAKIKGDNKGADKAFKDMKNNLDDIGKGFDNLKNNSATASATNSMKEFGKETNKAKTSSEKLRDQQIQTSSAISEANSTMIAKMSETTSKITEAGQAMQTAFNVEGSTEGIQKYAQSSVEILDRFGQSRTQLTDKYNQLMEQAESASGNKKVSLTRQALESVLAANVQGGEDLQSLYKSNKEMLVNNKTQEGQELTQEQRNALMQQNQAIRDGLIEQQELFVNAAQQKMKLGQEMSNAEIEALKSNLTALNNNHKEQLEQNNQEIAALEQANQVEQNEVTRANNEAKINTLKAHNEQVNASMAENAAMQLQQMTEQDQLKLEAMKLTLDQMGITTQEGLMQVYQHYVASGASIEQQMTLMGVMLQNKGVEGSQNLINALNSGDKVAVGKAMSNQVVQGISGLPNEMFKGGDSGKQKFIEALKSGDIQSAGKYLSDEATAGADTGKPKMGNSGKGNADEYNKNVKSKKGESKQAGSDNSTAAADGAKQQSPKHSSAGKTNGDNYVKGVRSKKSDSQNAGRENSTATVNGLKTQLPAMRSTGNQGGSMYATGIRSQNGSATSAGSGLANSAKAGASSVSFNSVGSNMAAGVAAGINAGAGAAVAAMASLVARVNAEAKKKAEIKSPSRLLKREVGKQLSAGVAVGIKDNADMAIEQARNLVSGVYRAMSDLTNPRSSGVNFTVEGQVEYGSDKMIDRLDRMITLLEEKTQIILDTGALVGATAGAYDESLGRKTSDKGRWN